MCIAQKSRPSSNVKAKGQGHRGQQTKKYGILFESGPRERGPPPVLCRWENQRMLSSLWAVVVSMHCLRKSASVVSNISPACHFYRATIC